MKKKIMATVLAVAVVAAATPAISADAATVKSSYVVGVNKTKTIKVPAKVKKVTVKNKAIVKATKSGKKVTFKGKKAGKTKVTINGESAYINLGIEDAISVVINIIANNLPMYSISFVMTAHLFPSLILLWKRTAESSDKICLCML